MYFYNPIYVEEEKDYFCIVLAVFTQTHMPKALEN
jgi:hypothetical protein